jgi:hypothetical protein
MVAFAPLSCYAKACAALIVRLCAADELGEVDSACTELVKLLNTESSVVLEPG